MTWAVWCVIFYVCAGPSRASLSYVLLHGFKLADPAQPQQGLPLLPQGLISRAAAAAADGSAAAAGGVVLSLRDVRILVDSATLLQHVAYFATMPHVRVYTVSQEGGGETGWAAVGASALCWLKDQGPTGHVHV
jgi:hypothetical protein